MKRALALTYALVVATMAAATWIEHLRGTAFVAQHIYGAWWFTLLWAVLAALGVAWIVRQRMRRWSTLLLHASFVVILCGALLTHLTASRGVLHLRQGESTDSYSAELPGGATEARRLPFHITLDSFRVHYHAGTTAERDYSSHFTLRDGRARIPGPYLMEYEQGQRDAFHRACVDMDAKLRLIMSLRDGSALALFPHATLPDGTNRWRHTAAPRPPDGLPRLAALFLRSYLALLREPLLTADYPAANRLIDKLDKYQHLHAGGTLPTPTADRAERLTNAIPFATLLFILNLTVGLLAMLYTLRRLTSQRDAPPHRPPRPPHHLRAAHPLLRAAHPLRSAPLANGYETMLLIAWFVHPIALLAARRFPIALPFGALLSGFFLLVSHLAPDGSPHHAHHARARFAAAQPARLRHYDGLRLAQPYVHLRPDGPHPPRPWSARPASRR